MIHWQLNSRSAHALLFTASALAGAGWLFSVQVLSEMPPLVFIGSRFFLAGLIIGLFGRSTAVFLRWSFLNKVLPGAFVLALSMILWITGLQQTESPGIASFITATGNLLVPLWTAVLFGWRVSHRTLVALAIALVGLAFLFLGPGASLEYEHLFFAGAAVFWACSMALIKKQLAEQDAVPTTAGQLAVSGVLILVIGIPLEGTELALPSIVVTGWFFASLVLSTVLRFVLQFLGQQAVSPARGGLIMSLEPAWALVMSMTFLREIITPTQILGCSIVLGALVWDLWIVSKQSKLFK